MSFSIRLVTVGLFAAMFLSAQNNTSFNPRWWAKYQYMLNHGACTRPGPTGSAAATGPNVYVSNECGPQRETFVTLTTRNAHTVAGGAKYVFRPLLLVCGRGRSFQR